jgi:hypothetical protein
MIANSRTQMENNGWQSPQGVEMEAISWHSEVQEKLI